MDNIAIRTFLSANSANGFSSYFDELNDFENVYVIKGGPGTGKSSFMKRVAANSVAEKHFTEYVYCSSDPDSLDAVCIGDIPLAVCDGTKPHIFEPKNPGACGGIVNLGEFWNENELKPNKDDIKKLGKLISECYEKAYLFLSAAGNMYTDIRKTALKFADENKAEKVANRFIERHFADKQPKKAKTRHRFLTGITPKGIVSFTDSLYSLCEKVYIIDDKCFISDLILEKILKCVAESGYDSYAFYSPLMSSHLRHIAVPEVGIAVASSDFFTHFDDKPIIKMSKMIIDGINSESKPYKDSFNIMKKSLESADECLKEAKRLHDGLEAIYMQSMDFSAVNGLSETFCKKYIRC